MPDLLKVAHALLLTIANNLFRGICLDKGLWAHHFSAASISSWVTLFSRSVCLKSSSKSKLSVSIDPSGFIFFASSSSTVVSGTSSVSTAGSSLTSTYLKSLDKPKTNAGFCTLN
jgi:hypothetical protein